MKKPVLRFLWLAIGLTLWATGCSNTDRKETAAEFEYEEPEPHPFVEPDIVLSHQYLATTPSGNLYKLVPDKIVVAELSDFEPGTDPRGYLKSLASKGKQEGLPFIPFHYYVSPEGLIFEGQNAEYQGYLGGKRRTDSLLVGVLGHFDGATDFLPPQQEKALVQQCSWLCMEHAISPQSILPAEEVDPGVGQMGVNLRSWFGPTRTLQTYVEKTLANGQEKQSRENAKDAAKRQSSSPASLEEMF